MEPFIDVGKCRFPDFLNIGIQKGGTTWLYRQLCMHPEISRLPTKELSYYNQST